MTLEEVKPAAARSWEKKWINSKGSSKHLKDGIVALMVRQNWLMIKIVVPLVMVFSWDDIHMVVR